MGRLATYSIAGSELLLSANDGTTALGGVEGALSLDDSLSRRGSAAGLGADLGDVVPVIHFGGVVCVEGM